MAVNRFDQLIDQFEPVLRRAFLDAVYAMRDAAHIEQIARMLEAGDVFGAVKAVGLDPTQFRELDKAISDTFEAGGTTTAKIMPIAQDAAGFRTVFQFAIRNPEAEQWLREHSSGLVKDILDDQREMIRTNLSAALAKGQNPRTAALDLVGRINAATGKREGGTIGLTKSQEEWVRAYRDDLTSEKPSKALSRALRDKRFDAAVARAERNGEPVPAELLNKMVTAYRNRALRYRAETIARSETITALHKAQDMALDQAVTAGVVRPEAITVTWRSARDKRVRDAHRELDGTRIPKGGTFQSSLGPIRYPGDPMADIANTAQCRCWLEPNVDFLAGIR